MVSMGCSCAVSRYRRLTMTDSVRATRPRDRKAQLAAVAAELFRARGFPGVGIKDIADAAGVTGPALYRHFADKQAILAYVVSAASRIWKRRRRRRCPTPFRPLSSSMPCSAGSRPRPSNAGRSPRCGAGKAVTSPRRTSGRSPAVRSLALDGVVESTPGPAPGSLPAEDAELLCWAALSVFGSVSVHHTTVARRRFAQLLVELALECAQRHTPHAVFAAVFTGCSAWARRRAASRCWRRRPACSPSAASTT